MKTISFQFISQSHLLYSTNLFSIQNVRGRGDQVVIWMITQLLVMFAIKNVFFNVNVYFICEFMLIPCIGKVKKLYYYNIFMSHFFEPVYFLLCLFLSQLV